jgi:hypothetical protein
MQRVQALLHPGEELPYALAGFASHTTAAVAAYADAYRAGAAGLARQVLFEALWLHGFDLDDPCVVHALIVDAVRTGAKGTDPVAAWEYGTGLTHESDTTTQNLIATWAKEWGRDGNQTVPTLCVGDQLLHGVDAVKWLGAELGRRGLPSRAAPQPTRTCSTP